MSHWRGFRDQLTVHWNSSDIRTWLSAYFLGFFSHTFSSQNSDAPLLSRCLFSFAMQIIISSSKEFSHSPVVPCEGYWASECIYLLHLDLNSSNLVDFLDWTLLCKENIFFFLMGKKKAVDIMELLLPNPDFLALQRHNWALNRVLIWAHKHDIESKVLALNALTCTHSQTGCRSTEQSPSR